ncbi:MAG: ammonia-forming cytochrome c nitrite reductase subunit c552 [Thiobacillus sp.]
MNKQRFFSSRWLAGAAVALLALGAQAAAPAAKPVDVKKCYACHDNIEEFHANGKHAKVNCASCHTGTDEHLASRDKKAVKPVTVMDHRACATCHKDQYDSFVTLNYDSGARIEKATTKSRSPLFDKLMEGYGFTIEHGEPRSHAFMLVDQWVVDRGFGGRFQFKNWTYNTKAEAAANNAWDVIVDKEPESSDQKKFMRQTVTAVNPVCMNCKTQDHILNWKYMGDKDPNAKWDRTSKPVEFARGVKHALNCFMCHDPHSTGPRVVRDALIEAVVDRKLGTYPMDAEKSKQTTMTKVTFDRDGKPFRAIGLLNKGDSNLMCAQCHVEYNCGPGFDCADKDKPVYITMADPRTNLFPWTNVFGYKKVMTEDYKFKDFKHASTGALLPKIQHPEMETFWGSKHERAGVQCKDCHMPKVKNAKGKVITSHQQISPRSRIKETCLKCHTDWTEKDAVYNLNAIQEYTRGKMAKAEFWLANLIDTINKAKEAGVSKEVMEKAYDHQYDGTLYWEWWTAENSDGFHNPEDARESLTRSIDASKDGIAMLKKAMGEMKAPKPAPAIVGDAKATEQKKY